jgi:hypothetical protein
MVNSLLFRLAINLKTLGFLLRVLARSR